MAADAALVKMVSGILSKKEFPLLLMRVMPKSPAEKNSKWLCRARIGAACSALVIAALAIGCFLLPKEAPLLASITVIMILGVGTGWFLQVATDKLKPEKPETIASDEVWEKIYLLDRTGEGDKPCLSAGAWIGMLERILFLAALWSEAYVLIGGWLALKVAAKWEVWKNVVQVPDTIGSNKEHDVNYLQSRAAWGGWLYSRFLAGTLANVVIALIGFYVGKHWSEIVAATFSLCLCQSSS